MFFIFIYSFYFTPHSPGSLKKCKIGVLWKSLLFTVLLKKCKGFRKLLFHWQLCGGYVWFVMVSHIHRIHRIILLPLSKIKACFSFFKQLSVSKSLLIAEPGFIFFFPKTQLIKIHFIVASDKEKLYRKKLQGFCLNRWEVQQYVSSAFPLNYLGLTKLSPRPPLNEFAVMKISTEQKHLKNWKPWKM